MVFGVVCSTGCAMVFNYAGLHIYYNPCILNKDWLNGVCFFLVDSAQLFVVRLSCNATHSFIQPLLNYFVLPSAHLNAFFHFFLAHANSWLFYSDLPKQRIIQKFNLFIDQLWLFLICRPINGSSCTIIIILHLPLWTLLCIYWIVDMTSWLVYPMVPSLSSSQSLFSIPTSSSA